MVRSANRKRWLSLLALLLVWTMTAGAVPVRAQQELNLASEAAVLMNADTGQVLYSKNMHQRMYPASITKVMTGMLAVRELAPDQVLTVSQEAVDAVPRTSSHIGLQPGMEMTVDQAMHALAMVSANDAANVLGEAVSGDLESFGRLMTAEAAAAGALDTHFTNANGLPDENHYTTAYDMAKIVAAALQVPGFEEYFRCLNYYDDDFSFENPNRMLPGGQFAYDGVVMSKTGWTSSALGTLVTAVRQGDTTLIAVVMKTLILEEKYQDTVTLMDYGFRGFYWETITGEIMSDQLPLGEYMTVRGQKHTCLLPVDTTPKEVRFTLAEGMDLESATADQTAVIVKASINGLELPDMGLVLVRKDAPPEVLAEAEQMFASEDYRDDFPLLTQKQGLILGLCVLVFLLAELVLHQRRRRGNRRRRLEGRIRQMKKQMEQ